MKLTVVIPGLFWRDRGDIDYLYSKIKIDNLNTLFRRATITTLNYGYSNLLYTATSGVKSGHLANGLAKQLNIQHEYNNFLIAEPTHLRLDRNRLLITEPELLQLNQAEELYIINTINYHFNDKIKLYYIKESLWLIGHQLDLSTCKFFPIMDIIGEDINHYLPHGSPDAIKLNAFINEIQMLLFGLPFNHERKKEGLQIANSLWLSDTTIMPEICTSFKHIITNSSSILTNHDKIQQFPTPIEIAFTNNNMVIVDNLYYPCCYRDSFDWMDKLHNLDQTIGLTLRQLLHSQKIRGLNILVPGQTQTICLNIRYSDKYKFWRKRYLINLVKDSYAF